MAPPDVKITPFMLWTANRGPPPWAKNAVSNAIAEPTKAIEDLDPEKPTYWTTGKVPKPKPAENITVANAAPDPSADKKPDSKPDSNKPENKKPDNKKPDNNKPAAMTAADDAQLLALKADSKNTWKQISDTMGQPPHILKKRFGELKKAETQANNAANTEAPATTAAAPATTAAAEKPKPAAHTANTGKKSRAAPATAPARSDARELYPDDLFNADELVLIAHILRRDHAEVWQRMASAFFDRTGRRVHPLDFEYKIRGVSAN